MVDICPTRLGEEEKTPDIDAMACTFCWHSSPFVRRRWRRDQAWLNGDHQQSIRCFNCLCSCNSENVPIRGGLPSSHQTGEEGRRLKEEPVPISGNVDDITNFSSTGGFQLVIDQRSPCNASFTDPKNGTIIFCHRIDQRRDDLYANVVQRSGRKSTDLTNGVGRVNKDLRGNTLMGNGFEG